MTESEKYTVLVTGGSGFVASHCIVQLLAAGHAVRTTVRKLQREPSVRAMIQEGGADDPGRLSFFEADLERDTGWAEAARGCDYVLHVASPFPPGIPRDENELIIPAREGTLRVLRASRDAGSARGPYVFVCVGRLRPRAADRAVRRDRLDESVRC